MTPNYIQINPKMCSNTKFMFHLGSGPKFNLTLVIQLPNVACFSTEITNSVLFRTLSTIIHPNNVGSRSHVNK